MSNSSYELENFIEDLNKQSIEESIETENLIEDNKQNIKEALYLLDKLKISIPGTDKQPLMLIQELNNKLI